MTSPPTSALGAADTPVRVMLLLGSLCGGGAERVAVNLAGRCDRALVDVTVGLLRREGAFLGEVDPSRVAGPDGARSGLVGVARAPGEIARMVYERRPQVLMTFGMGVGLLTWLALLAPGLGLGRRRPVWICREDSNTEAEVANAARGRLRRAALGWAVGRVYRSADGLLAVSQDLARELERRLALPPGRARVIHNPTDVARVARAAARPLDEAPRRPFIVTAGRLTHQKGHDLLIDAFAACGAAREMDLVILGEGPLEGALRARAEALGVGERVKFPGFAANPWAWFARGRLFVLPSRWEGFGNVVAEAMACGVPVLATDCDFGPREQVAHGLSGWVVAAGDAAALAQGIKTLLADDDLSARLAAGGAARVGDFDVDKVAEAYADYFRELVGEAAARP